MTVDELIRQLELMPRDYQVRLYAGHCGCAQDALSVEREDSVRPGMLDWGADGRTEGDRVVWISDQQ
jgi:hypothetical protein